MSQDNTDLSKIEESETSVTEDKKPIGNFVQLINSEEEFLPTFDEFLKQFEIPALDYFIISTFGPQSTGKSTLLNMLFDTDFPTMNQARGRYQCTLGVYCSYPKKIDNVLVFDLEGTDSGERGDHKGFEKKISIFALAASEILIVNNLLTDIGRYVGSNLSLLHTCFQLNIQLFLSMKKTRKTLLLFTLRDYDPNTNFRHLKEQIMESVEGVWSKVVKPPALKESKLEDFFDFRFVTLPHFVFQKEDFVKKVDDMRTLFQSESNSFVYEREKYSHHIPITDLPVYLGDIWTVIKENKDVDIPTQRKMLAIFRCDEISAEIVEDAEEEKFKKWVKAICERKKIVKKLGSKALELFNKYLNKFDQDTELYLPKVVEEKRIALDRKLRDKFKIECSQPQLALSLQNSVVFFKKFVDKKMEVGGNQKSKRMVKFAGEIRKVKAATLKFFEEFSKDCFLPDETEYNEKMMAEKKEKLMTEVGRYSALLRKQQLNMMIEEHKNNFASTVEIHLKKLLKKPKKDFWDRARKVMSSLLSSTKYRVSQEEVAGDEALFREELVEGFECKVEETERFLLEMKKYIYGVGVSVIRGHVKYLPSEMIKSFESEFPTLNLGGSGHQVFKKYKRGRTAGLNLLNLFFFHRFHIVGSDRFVKKLALQKLIVEGEVEPSTKLPNEEEEEGEGEGEGEEIDFFEKYYEFADGLKVGFPHNDDAVNPSTIVEIFFPDFENEYLNEVDERTILSEDKVLMIYKDFQHAIEYKYIQAKSMDMKYNIPWWLYIVIAGLGWNEFMYVVRTPLLLLVILATSVLFGWNKLKNYIEIGLREREFNFYVDFALRRMTESLPQVFGENFGRGKPSDDDEDNDQDFDNDENDTPDKVKIGAAKINYGDGGDNTKRESDKKDDMVRKRDLKSN